MLKACAIIESYTNLEKNVQMPKDLLTHKVIIYKLF